MASAKLSSRDLNVLEKIRDPEFDPAAAVRLETSLPADPHVRDAEAYRRVADKEREIVSRLQQAENQLDKDQSEDKVAAAYKEAVSSLDQLIDEYPQYASARNNRTQALRRLYGDSIMISQGQTLSQGLVSTASAEEQGRLVNIILSDLDKAVSLLSPKTPWQALSPIAAQTLSLAHTQRAAIYHATSKLVAQGLMQVQHGRAEAGWSALEFEGAASRDFALGGKYGNEIAKGLAVSTNPTAKLCGQMVQEMMRKEYGEGYAK